MNFYACLYEYGPAEEQAKFRPDHRSYLGTLLEEGKLAASGPFTTGGIPGALLIFKAESIAEIEEIIAHDPMNIGGAVLSFEIRQWNPVLGSVGQ
ncbi:MAG: YciI family protein [Rothia sp. (in: high G+C Gram-positive bacteria)]|nr:YciI family protein [Rothia sp. (in: high G+C Gram-positive bacteria)]